MLQGLAFLLFATTAMALASVDPETGKRTPSYTLEGDDACLRCHAGPGMRAVRSGPHKGLRAPSAPSARNGCESCHGRGSIHISRAHGGRGFPPLIRFGHGAGKEGRAQQVGACLQCHETAAETGTTIAFYGTPHDRDNINCSSCHELHVETDPIKARETQSAVCSGCHSGILSGHPGTLNVRVMKCSDCHTIHRRPPQ